MAESLFSIKTLKYGLNKVLSSHVDQMSLKHVKLTRRTVFIYNIAPMNIFASIGYKFLGYKIYYHLHDPLPHRGWKRLPIFVFQYIQVLFAHRVIVFSKSLIELTKKYYWFYGKIKIAHHGLSIALRNLEPVSEQYQYGWFGAHASYKHDLNISYCLKVLDSSNAIFVGKGYPMNLTGRVFSAYLNDREYFSLMDSVDYIVVVYKDISFSGVIHDGVALGKSFVANQLCKNYILKNYPQYQVVKIIDRLFILNCTGPKSSLELGWSKYVKEVFYD